MECCSVIQQGSGRLHSPQRRGRLVILLLCGWTDNKSLSPSLLWDTSLNSSQVRRKKTSLSEIWRRAGDSLWHLHDNKKRESFKKKVHIRCSSRLSRKTSSNDTLMWHHCARQTELGQRQIRLHGEVAEKSCVKCLKGIFQNSAPFLENKKTFWCSSWWKLVLIITITDKISIHIKLSFNQVISPSTNNSFSWK